MICTFLASKDGLSEFYSNTGQVEDFYSLNTIDNKLSQYLVAWIEQMLFKSISFPFRLLDQFRISLVPFFF